MDPTYDFDMAWEHKHAYAIIKSAIHKIFTLREDFNPENPYDELISTITTTGMIQSAFQIQKNIEVRYGWEMIDEANVIMHSCFGLVDKIDIQINAEDYGFLMNLGDGVFAAFSYKKIFWICEADMDRLK